MKSGFVTVVILIGLITLSHGFVGVKAILQPSPTRWTFKEACRQQPRPDWCREFFQDLEHGRRWAAKTG
jgi:hypothetical protein